MRKRRSRGFTLIASLLMLALLSGIAVGLMYLVTGAGRMGSNDMEANIAFYGAEAGMEKLTGDVLSLYQTKMSPTQSDLNDVAASSPPSSALVGGMTYLETVAFTGGSPQVGTSVLSSGPYAGLTAETLPLTLNVTAMRPFGATVNMTRGVAVALIPVFQFGVFSDSDLSYFPGPLFGFQGRVHTNGNLFLAANSGPLILDAKVTSVGEILRDRLANNFSNGAGYQGSVFIPNSNGGCDTYIGGGAQGPNCVDFGADSNNATNDASWSGGIPPAGAANSGWSGVQSSFNGMVATQVNPLQLPFVQGTTQNDSTQQIQIIRKPVVGELASSPIGSSREYNKATIRILLADTQADLHPERGPLSDGGDVQLDNSSVLNVKGTPGGSTSFFAVADTTVGDANWTNATMPRCGGALPGQACTPYAAGTTQWPLVKGWLRVEYLDKTSGAWVAATNEWLGYGFARTLLSRSAPGVDTTGHPYAMLILQELADRNGNGTVANGASDPNENASITGAKNNFYPINFYDPREGFPRDFSSGNIVSYSPAVAGTQGYANGIMNSVELDVGNLSQWLKGNGAYAGGNGANVNYINQNGYLLYFSDRRGMEPDPDPGAGNITTGEYGFEDTVNSASASGTPDGLLETTTAGYNANNGFSPEDVDENNLIDTWGAIDVGDGFGLNTSVAPRSPYVAIDCFNGGRQNLVSGARHVLKLVDGGLNNLPVRLDNNLGGFTVAAENPVYIQGNYNSDNTDTFWGNPSQTTDIAHAAAGIIADSVTLLSNSWSDLNSMANPLTYSGASGLNKRGASETFYRMAIAGGKNMNFPYQGTFPGDDFGTDGGVHNFLRYIEAWGCCQLHYRGSLVSLFYSQYATGIFKCCNQVYGPPKRDYYFDNAFLNPANLPPGTPMMQDIENLSYWQSFNPCTTQNSSTGNCTN